MKEKPTLRELKQEKKKEDILRAAADVFIEKGYYRTTMEDVAAKLFMTKGSVYYYFADKQDLLFQSQVMLLKRGLLTIKEILNEEISAKEKLKKSLIQHIEHLINERSGFSMLIKPEQDFTVEQESIIFELREEYGKCFDFPIEEGIQTGIFQTNDPKIVRNLLLGAMNSLVQWYSPNGKKSKQEFADHVADYLLRMLVVDTE
ncbi:TetR/AcrR family transcriptional regulator [Ornithinibacillus californiensis]|uniref:TetR/AcrR family transcriptional regulator n=1 Tax=Ornithinibacillus californiensis TaxID=161536 RepID=UPI00064DF90B|nr:TetR/AcrR family transcriptional regulator [Ornithinibacillus californiensis]